MTENTSYTAAYPREQRCDLSVECVDGTRYAGRCTMIKGEPANPVTEAELERKFFELRRARLGRDADARDLRHVHEARGRARFSRAVAERFLL